MSFIDEEIEVAAPIRATYDQWTQFEEFPRFMSGVESVHQLDDTTLHWVADIAGVRREWDARITEQIPDQLVAWVSLGGVRHDGLVTFDAVGAHRTRVTLRLDLEPEGAVESIGDALGIVAARARGDLARFQRFIEGRLVPTGAWRGEVVGGDVADPPLGAPGVQPVGEVPASTGGVVDLDRLLGRIPVVLIFVEPLDAATSHDLIAALGEHLVDFGRDRVQVLAVARVETADAERVADAIEGNLRVLADPEELLARRFGAEYRLDRTTALLVDADGSTTTLWSGPPSPGAVASIRSLLWELDDD